MKKLIIIFSTLFFALPTISLGQGYSYNGKTHTLHDTLRVLFLYIGFTDTDHQDDVNEWPHDEVPDWAKGGYNQVIDTDLDSLGAHLNLTYYYHSMSQGRFVLIGDVFPELIRVPRDTASRGAMRYSAMTSAAFDTINARIARGVEPYASWDWSQYDRRKNKSTYSFDNSLYSDDGGTPAGPDGKIDHITIIFRDLDGVPGGYAGSLSKTIYTTTDTLTTGPDVFHWRAFRDSRKFNTWWHHEFAHSMYNSAHFFNNNNTAGTRWYANKGWGFMAGPESPFETALAWEAWWMGWIEPKNVSRDTIIRLKDYVTEGDVLRIPIPFTDSTHYLWIENHQMIHDFDQRFYYAEYLPSTTGLYAYVTARGGDRSKPGDMGVTGNNAGMIKILNAKGNFDFTWDRETTIYAPGTGAERPALVRQGSNPIAGQHDFQIIRFDKDTNGVITTSFGGNSAANEHLLFFAEIINDTPTVTNWGAGAPHLAFQVGDEIGISGNVPALNLPEYDIASRKLEAYILNGLSVNVLGYDSTSGEFLLRITFNDWEVDTDRRWCGDIIQPAGSMLKIAGDVEIVLDRTGTPNRHLKDSIYGFHNPTSYTIADDAGMILGQGATVRIRDHSTFTNKGSIQLSDSARIIVESTGVLDLQRNDITWLGSGATVIIEAGGTLRTAGKVDLTFAKEGYFQLQEGAIVDFGD